MDLRETAGVLDWVQDENVENVTLTGRTPSDPANPDAPQRAAELPHANATIVNGELICWYGGQGSPALSVPPLALDSE